MEYGVDKETMDEMAILIMRLCHSLKKVQPDSELPEKAMDYLRRKNLLKNNTALRS